MINRKWGWPLIVVNFLALLDSIYLTWHHYQIEILQPSTSSFCSINSYIDCDSVAASSYSRILGIPASSLGIFAYTFLLILCCNYFFVQKRNSKKHFNLSFLIIVLMFFFSLYQFFISMFVLKAFCLMCCGLYVCIAFMLLFNFRLLGKPSAKEAINNLVDLISLKSLHSTSLYFINFLLSAVLAFGISSFIKFNFSNLLANENLKNQKVQNTPQTPLEVYNGIKEVKIDYTGLPYEGASDAPFVFLEISDFECPFCSSRGRELLKLIRRFEGIVKIYFLHYPLDQKCNKNITQKFHEHACIAAKYAICAQEQGKFWKYHDFLFNNQKHFSDRFFKASINKFAFDEVKFKECLASRASNILIKDLDMANKMQVNYTPTIYLNGREISNKLPRQEQIIALLEQIMKESLE